MTAENSSPFRLDMLKELGNIGAGHATTALSNLLGGRSLQMVVPEAVVVNLTESMHFFGGPEAYIAGIYVAISGDVDAHMALMFPIESALSLAQLLTGSASEWDDLHRSAIAEVGNIVVASYINALSDLTGMRIVPSVPAVAFDMAAAIWNTILAGVSINEDFITLVKTSFVSDALHIKGSLFLVPGEDTFDRFASALGVEIA